MSEYEKSLDFIKKYAKPIYRFKGVIANIEELVEKEQNGIYFSKKEVKKLLKALETVKEEVREYGWQHCEKEYNKLYKALGGK